MPWLQDTPQANVWRTWKVTNRDVVMLDGENRVFRVYNLTDHDLSAAGNYAELRGILLAAAGGPASANYSRGGLSTSTTMRHVPWSSRFQTRE